ncbi:MAG: hypothetical protein GY820_17440 [Gammaproteobacteria bacterium]|nr:hypothetical protein [Gammaproteobacteria bacterium]
MFDCVLIGTKPCKYFQLNASVFNAEEGIFSKIEIDRLIPEKWRLKQYYDDGETIPTQFPVFVKPEWGQNSRGVFRADNESSLQEIRHSIGNSRIRYMIQAAAPGKLEFEIFSILHHRDKQQFAHLTVSQATNKKEPYPVNSIRNPDTQYRDIGSNFNERQIQILWGLLGEIERFPISRVGLRANSVEDMLAGRFHIIEINLFIPMPINMLDPDYGFFKLWKLGREYMMSLARITRARDKSLNEKPVFTKQLLYNRNSPILNYIRDRI